MEGKFVVTNVQILKNSGDVLANIGINNKFLLQLKMGGYYIPFPNEDCWGQNHSEQGEFKETVILDNLLRDLELSNVKSVSELRTYCENNYILVEVV